MKLIIAIINDADSQKTSKELIKNNYRVTKLATTGGFLKAGNTTILCGCEDEQVDGAIDILKNNCQERTEYVPAMSVGEGFSYISVAPLVPITIGGATVFIIDIDKYIKL